MKKEEVIKWLMIMKANLNSFPEINCGNKIEALAEAIRLLKNEQSSSSEKPNKSENLTSSTNTISFKEMTDNLKITADDIENAEDLEYSIEPLVHPKNDLGVDCISRQELLKIYEDRFSELQKLKHLKDNKGAEDRQMGVNYCINILKELPPVTPIRPKGHWIDHSDEGYVECPKCGSATNCDDNINDLHFCFSCGAKMEEVEK